MDLDAVTLELYGLTPAEFTASRDARASEARRAGHKDLAAEIKKLKRPTVAAWLANLLVRQRPVDIDQLLGLGHDLREATDHLAGDELRRLSQQRREIVLALVQEARKLAKDAGQTASEAAARELQETLEAALADPAAADALRSGRLTTSLAYTGLGVNVAGGPTSVADAGPPAGARTPTPSAQEGQQASAVKEAEAALAAARQHTAERVDVWARARDESDALRLQVETLARQLESLRADLTRVDQKAESLEQAVEEAKASELAAQRHLARAKTRQPAATD